jgi:hypothetical protein
MINKDDVSVLFHLAKAYNKIGNKNKAHKIYKYVTKFSKDNTVMAK